MRVALMWPSQLDQSKDNLADWKKMSKDKIKKKRMKLIGKKPLNLIPRPT